MPLFAFTFTFNEFWRLTFAFAFDQLRHVTKQDFSWNKKCCVFLFVCVLMRSGGRTHRQTWTRSSGHTSHTRTPMTGLIFVDSSTSFSACGHQSPNRSPEIKPTVGASSKSLLTCCSGSNIRSPLEMTMILAFSESLWRCLIAPLLTVLRLHFFHLLLSRPWYSAALSSSSISAICIVVLGKSLCSCCWVVLSTTAVQCSRNFHPLWCAAVEQEAVLIHISLCRNAVCLYPLVRK